MIRVKLIHRKLLLAVIFNFLFLLLFNQNVIYYLKTLGDIQMNDRIVKMSEDIYVVSGFWDTREVNDFSINGPGMKSIRAILKALLTHTYLLF